MLYNEMEEPVMIIYGSMLECEKPCQMRDIEKA